MEINKNDIFELIRNQEFDKLHTIIKSKKIKNFDIKDTNYMYFIQYIILHNQYEILQTILELTKNKEIYIRLDIIDSDGRTILYNCIKYNYNKITKLLIKYNKILFGISIIDIKDKLGYSPLHISVIFNNFESFKLLIENEADPYLSSNEGTNVFSICIIYNRIDMFNYLIEKKFNINIINNNGETLLQIAIPYENNIIINKLLETNINLNNISSNYGLSVLHQSIIFNNFDLFKKILEKNVDINLADFWGNTVLHHILIDKRINFLEIFMKQNNIIFNISNINGETPLHLLLDMDISNIKKSIIERFLIETDLNIQDNNGISCLMKIVNNELLIEFKDILVIKPLNFYIEDNNFNSIKITDDIINIIVESYYNQIKIKNDELIIEWEKWCSKDMYDKLKTLNIKGNNSEEICKNKIKEIIIKEKRTLPNISNINLKLDSGIFTNFCYFTGSPIDVLFGLLLLYNDFKNKYLNLILDYPLTINESLEKYYKKIALDYPYKLDFSNIEIIWSYQKIFFPSYFDFEIKKKIKDSKYIVIPIGIETSISPHANILFWDIEKKTIERFEPNGSNFPMGMNYNPKLLDSLLENKFKDIEPEIEYIAPYKFLPTIGFQILENIETEKCKKLGDPNGFCAVWCIWWVYQRMLNIDNNKLNIYNLADELIKYIKFDNKSFKNIIRNFSNKITNIRDIFLKKNNLDINDWIVGNYSIDDLNNIEKNIFKYLI